MNNNVALDALARMVPADYLKTDDLDSIIIGLLEDIAMDKHIDDIARGIFLSDVLALGKLPPVKEPPKTTGPQTSGTIVIAEDDEVTRLLLSRVLTRAGFTVYACENGRLACEAVRCNGADVVLLDWMMPVMDGPSVVAYLKANLDTRGIPVVMLTTHSNSAERVAAFNTGVQDFLTKPFNTRELVARIAQQMCSRKTQAVDENTAFADEPLERYYPPEKGRPARISGDSRGPHVGVRAA